MHGVPVRRHVEAHEMRPGGGRGIGRTLLVCAGVVAAVVVVRAGVGGVGGRDAHRSLGPHRRSRLGHKSAEQRHHQDDFEEVAHRACFLRLPSVRSSVRPRARPAKKYTKAPPTTAAMTLGAVWLAVAPPTCSTTTTTA